MARNEEATRRQLPPYVSFKTFLGFIRKTKETIVPEKIDSDVLRAYPGSTARQLKSALRFFDLMDENDKPTVRLGALSAALDTDSWAPTFHDTVTRAYEPIVGDLPIQRTTRVQIEGRFREYQAAEREVLDRVVAFYVAALVSAGAKVSPLILERAKPRQNGKPRPRRQQPDQDPWDAGTDLLDIPGSGSGLRIVATVRFTVPIPDKSPATMLLPPDLTVDDWDMVSAMVTAYIKRKSKTGSAA
jgi:hypothetical protein